MGKDKIFLNESDLIMIQSGLDKKKSGIIKEMGRQKELNGSVPLHLFDALDRVREISAKILKFREEHGLIHGIR